MPHQDSLAQSDGLKAGRIVKGNGARWGQAPFLDASRFLLLATIWAAVWMIGGFYHLPRFLILSSLAAALLLAWLDLRHITPMLRATRWLWVIGFGVLSIGLFQLVPLPPFLASILSGTFSLRQDYASLDADAWSVISLVPWETCNWLAMTLIGVVGMFLGAALFQTPKAKLVLLGAIAICGATQVFWGIVQIVVHPEEIFWGVANEGGTTPFGTFLVRNHGADFVGMALFCALGLLHYLQNHKGSSGDSAYVVSGGWHQVLNHPGLLALGLLVVWLAVGLICSNSRGGWTSFAVAFVAAVLAWKRKGRPRQLGRIVGFLVIAIGAMLVVQAVGLLDRFEERVDDLSVDRVMADGRWELWKDSIPALLHFLPLGSGLGTYGYAILPFEPTPSRGWLPNAHQQYLEAIVEAGVPGLLLIGGFLWVAGRATVSLCQSDRTREKQALGIAGLGTLLFQALHAFTEFGLLMPANLLTACVLIGAAVASSPSGRASSSRVQRGALSGVSTKDVAPQIKSGQGTQGHSSSLVVGLLVFILGAGLAAAIWHQARCVRADRLLASTEFAPSTPSPTVATADQWIESIEDELARSPLNERLRRRLIQLQMHRAQRATYDQIRAGQIAQARPSNPIADWDRTSLESIIMQLYDDSDTGPTELQKQRIQKQIATEPSLAAAWSEFAMSLAANPVQPKTQLRMAQLAAASGRPWEKNFKNSMRLSAVDSRQTLGNGLLAWAAGDIEAMTQQWRQTLSVDLSHLELIYRLARLKLTDEAITEHLMPNNWVAPYRLALLIRRDPGTEALQELLYDRATSAALVVAMDPIPKQRALAAVAAARGDFRVAAEHYSQAVQADPKDSELRYRFALSLYHSGNASEAASQARVAMNLAPTNERYKRLFEQSKRLHHRQSTILLPAETP
ncbi:O-antigen ligase [Neorhodopirellula lusitana]|uniref:O-antigen ligase n=1 Tax=Neorhodopirellula lusitana TaxID=445327 RepID=A0ABY1Q0R3_9BACT|nr:O-antigen ligase family protein [Neorhodopirellula lusitana]SMP51694.1 O-antigen ligase [Neorhodopirellula lusitana]